LPDEKARPFLAQQAKTDLPDGPEDGLYDDKQQIQVEPAESKKPLIESEASVRAMSSSGRVRGADGKDEDLHDDAIGG
jgi:hypothetical protein